MLGGAGAGNAEEPDAGQFQLERRAGQGSADGDGHHGDEAEQGRPEHQAPGLGVVPLGDGSPLGPVVGSIRSRRSPKYRLKRRSPALLTSETSE